MKSPRTGVPVRTDSSGRAPGTGDHLGTCLPKGRFHVTIKNSPARAGRTKNEHMKNALKNGSHPRRLMWYEQLVVLVLLLCCILLLFLLADSCSSSRSLQRKMNEHPILTTITRTYEMNRHCRKDGGQVNMIMGGEKFSATSVPSGRQAMPSGRQAIPSGRQAIPNGRQALHSSGRRCFYIH